jgi:hypothetical protein
MRTKRSVASILASVDSTQLKILKLQNLALRQFPNSPLQKQTIEAYHKLEFELRLNSPDEYR